MMPQRNNVSNVPEMCANSLPPPKAETEANKLPRVTGTNRMAATIVNFTPYDSIALPLAVLVKLTTVAIIGNKDRESKIATTE